MLVGIERTGKGSREGLTSSGNGAPSILVIEGFGEANFLDCSCLGVFGLEHWLAAAENLNRIRWGKGLPVFEKPAIVGCLNFAVVLIDDLTTSYPTRLYYSTCLLTMVRSFSSLSIAFLTV